MDETAGAAAEAAEGTATGAAIAAVRGTIVGYSDVRPLDGDRKVQDVTVETSTWGDKKTQVEVTFWNQQVDALAAAGGKKGDRIEVEGDLRRVDWDSKAEAGKKDEKLAIVVDGESHTVAKASEADDLNMVRIDGGEVRWASAMDNKPRANDASKTTGHRDLMVAVPLVGPKGNEASPAFKVHTIGHEKVVEPLDVGDKVQLTGRIENRSWTPNDAPKTEGGTERRRYAGEVVVGFGDGGGTIEKVA